MAAQIFNNLKKRTPSRIDGWVHKLFLHFSGRNSIPFLKSVYKMARIGISHHPYHIFHLIFSALQQTMCHLHALFHYVLVDRTIKTGFEALLQFSFTEIALLRNLCDCQRVKEMIVNNFPGLHQAAIIFSGNLFVIFLLPNRFFAEQGDKFQSFLQDTTCVAFALAGSLIAAAKPSGFPVW